MVTSQDQKAGPSHNIKNDNSSFERLEQFKYLEQPKHQNVIQEELRAD